MNPDVVMFSGNTISAKILNLLYDRNEGHYNVSTNLKGGMAKRHICNGWDNLYEFSPKCDNDCSLCTGTPPCTKDQTKYCGTFNKGLSVRGALRIIQHSKWKAI